jgi:TonB family protein
LLTQLFQEFLTMKKHLSLLACLLLAATSAMAQTTAKTQSDAPAAPAKMAELHTWKTYTVKDEHVSASFPAHPSMSTMTRYRNRERQTLTDRMVGAYADGVVYGIYTFDNREPRDSFDDFVARQTQVGDWDLSTARTVNLGRYAGKEYSSRNKDLPATIQLFAVDNRLYQFIATGAPADDPGVKQFFSSITLERKGAIEVSDGPGIPLSDSMGLQVFTGKHVDSKARLVMKPEPQYTDDARRAALTGTVVLKVVFASSGTVTNIRTVSPLPYGLTEQAIAAARNIKFIPAVKDGKYVSMWYQLEYNFNLY